VRSLAAADPARIDRFLELLARASRHVDEWAVEDARQSRRIEVLRTELAAMRRLLAAGEVALSAADPWDRLYRTVENGFSLEAQELTVSLLIELYPELVDALADTMASRAETIFEPAMRVGELRAILHRQYLWALGIDLDEPDQRRLFWYVSEEKLEPRLGDRFAEPGDCHGRPGSRGRSARSRGRRERRRVPGASSRASQHRAAGTDDRSASVWGDLRQSRLGRLPAD
jgi:hypothetical protein